jgi:DNA end-binding protein Ku
VGQQAYALIRDVMIQSKLQAVAQVVISNKEQLVLLRPVDNLLGMFVLRYAAEVKPTSAFTDELVDTKPSEQELKLTKLLMDGLTDKKFDITKYSDTYMERLTALIQAKVEGKELVTPEATHEPRVINLMDALKASLEQVKPVEASAAAPRSRAASKTARERKPAARATSKKQRKSG